MFILAKSFTNKKMFLKIFPRQYPSIETAHAAMQPDYQEELKKRHLDRSDEDATADDVENMENYNVFVHSNKDSQDNGAPLAFASFCDDYPNREWTVLHI